MRPFPFLATVLSVAFLPTLAQAAPREPFEIVKGWEVERTVGDTSANPCIMTHTYEDKDDNNATNAVVFALDGSKASLVLAYQGWDFDKEETVKVPLFLDKKPIKIKTTWTGDGKTLRAQFPDTLVPDLLAAKTVILRFDNGEADFRIPNFAAGYEALRRCDAAPPKSSPQAAIGAAISNPAPSVPSQARIASYAVGIALQRVLKECDVASTGRQRAAVEARMAALQPEMAPFDANIREQLVNKGFSCPPADKEPDFQAAMTRFIDLSPEAFAAAMEKQGEPEKSAEAAPKP
ncbi:hypothetical protein ASG52_04175 [Methylobacterium sp. Leaf456]|uniref:hypothetical protein n=1 Tax=Methylobacterium sp. Leaf456 TaxID=1736382 RepID=UPI0006FC5948|nr:hypothetical protein [Methylobacterium sp. Leaf456]KQT53333.1 hypothetical protein ASG52_04175 [Methylobacterium sp. Leaf456]